MERLAGSEDAVSDQPRKRPLFQFHLSTAIVMMFVAAGLLWANLTPTVGFKETRRKEFVPSNTMETFTLHVEETLHYWGWPRQAASQVIKSTASTDKPVDFEDIYMWETPFGPLAVDIMWPGVAFNTVVAVCLLAGVMLFLEWLIRRKERRP
jgi:hypothetical protein